jgi:hypothetical protein
MFPQVHGYQVGLVCLGMLVPVAPLFMQTIDEVQRPFKVFFGCTAPNGNGMIFMRHFIDSGMLARLQHMHGRAKHLYGF